MKCIIRCVPDELGYLIFRAFRKNPHFLPHNKTLFQSLRIPTSSSFISILIVYNTVHRTHEDVVSFLFSLVQNCVFHYSEVHISNMILNYIISTVFRIQTDLINLRSLDNSFSNRDSWEINFSENFCYQSMSYYIYSSSYWWFLKIVIYRKCNGYVKWNIRNIYSCIQNARPFNNAIRHTFFTSNFR